MKNAKQAAALKIGSAVKEVPLNTPDHPDDKNAVGRSAAEIEQSSYNELCETIQLPPNMAMAFSTGRPELLALAKFPDGMDTKTAEAVVNAMRVILTTNQKLVRRCAVVEQQVDNLKGNIDGLINLANKVKSTIDTGDPQAYRAED